MIARGLMLLGALLVFGTVNWQIAGKERLRANGQTLHLELVPVDPRSMLQGDDMDLNFSLARSISGNFQADYSGSNVAILELDQRRVGSFVRPDNGTPLKPNEMRFRFRIRNGAVWLGTNAFFFREGDAARYAHARYGEFRVNDAGDAMLVNLRDKDLR